MLKLELSLGFADEDVEVLVVIQPKGKTEPGTSQAAPTVSAVSMPAQPMHSVPTPSHGEYED
jgi:hypothetical protein